MNMSELSREISSVNHKYQDNGMEHISGPLRRVLDRLRNEPIAQPDIAQDDGSHTEQPNFQWVANG
jgi:hypothetical protein